MLYPNDNEWSITIVGRFDRAIKVLPVNAPMELHEKILRLCRELTRVEVKTLTTGDS